MQNELKELLQFLHDKNPQVRQIALTNLVGHTAKGSPHREIFLAGLGGGGLNKSNENDCIRDLKLLCRDQLAIAHDAFRFLVNLSDSSILATSLSEPGFLTFLVSYILNSTSILADLASMLLSNITSAPSACAALIILKIPIIPLPAGSLAYYPPQSRSGTSPPPTPYPSGDSRDVQALSLLVQAFAQTANVNVPTEQRIRKADLHFLSSVFANLTMASAGRDFFLIPRPADVLAGGMDSELEYPLSQLVVFTEHTDTIRRGGVSSTIKNCAFHVPAHKAMLFPETELVAIPPSSVSAPAVNALPYVLLPLAGPEEFDLEDQEKLPMALQLLPDTKKREPDTVLRLTHIESLILLCATRAGRDYLRNNGVYEIVRALHLSEQNENVNENIERLVNLLKGEEKHTEDAEGDGWNHSKPTFDGTGSPQGLDAQGKTGQGRSEVDNAAPLRSPLGDDEDGKIMEV